MKAWKTMVVLLLVGLVAQSAVGQQQKKRNQQRKYPPTLEGAKVETYKTIGDTKLKLYIFEPDGHQPSDTTPAIVFFFGGGWSNGSPMQFEHQCRYFAKRGMVAITADYRVRTRHGVKVPQCIADAKSAVRWVRANAKKLGVDPDRIAAGGGSAGGHLAAATAFIKEFDEAGEDKSVSCVPNALVLFNPAAALAPFEGAQAFTDKQRESLAARFGDQPQRVSPAHHVSEGSPPTIVFFGTDDRLLVGAKFMQRRMKEVGSRCELKTWDGLGHGFFNWGRNQNKPFVETVRAADKFLTSLGYLEGEPTVEQYVQGVE